MLGILQMPIIFLPYNYQDNILSAKFLLGPCVAVTETNKGEVQYIWNELGGFSLDIMPSLWYGKDISTHIVLSPGNRWWRPMHTSIFSSKHVFIYRPDITSYHYMLWILRYLLKINKFSLSFYFRYIRQWDKIHKIKTLLTFSLLMKKPTHMN